jgi:hypothetical protein
MRKLTIYIVRLSSSGELRSSGPCVNCLRLIREFGIRKMVYSDEDGSIKEHNTYEYDKVHVSLGTRCLTPIRPGSKELYASGVPRDL